METVDKIILQRSDQKTTKGTPARAATVTNHDDGILKDYLRNSTFPIVRYVLGSDLRVTLKVFWLAVAMCLAGLFGFTVVVNYERLQDPSNVYLAEAEKALPMWSVPFPAVTLCARKGSCVSEPLQLDQFCEQICWQDVCTSDCETLLDAVRTERGICYTFNAVAGEQIFKSNKYKALCSTFCSNL